MRLDTPVAKAKMFMLAAHSNKFEGYGLRACIEGACYDMKSREQMASFLDHFGIEGYLNAVVDIDDGMFIELQKVANEKKVNSECGFSLWINSQRMLMDRYKKIAPELFDMDRNERLMRRSIALVGEAVEILNETPWKWWKDVKVSESKLLEELADLMHFVAEVVLELGSQSDEFLAYYLMKNAVNVLRQEGIVGKGFKSLKWR